MRVRERERERERESENSVLPYYLGEGFLDSCLSQRYESYVKYNEPCLGFERGSIGRFTTMITSGL